MDEEGNEQPLAQYKETLPDGRSYNVLDTRKDGPFDDTVSYIVPEGRYFLLGDNRDKSSDSRGTHNPRFLPEENIVGKVSFIFWNSKTLEASYRRVE